MVFSMAVMIAIATGGCGTEEQESTTASSGFDPNSVQTRSKTLTIENLINKHFYYEPDQQKREDYFYKGLIYGLGDKFATYYSPEEFAKITEEDEGEYVGIGATVSKNMDNGSVYVVEPIPGSPAEEVGLLPDDVFVEIDGVELTTDMELEDVVKMIRGQANITAHLKMYREGEDDFLEFDVPRRKIQEVTVRSEMLENGFGYIKVSEFIMTTDEQFKEAVDSLMAQGAKGLIFDLRNNPGGITNSAINMVDYLVEDDTVPSGGDPNKPGLLLELRDKNSNILDKSYTKDGHSVDLPMAILMNGNSASSSEIVIGCLRDYGKVKLVGEKSYGKGIVQQTFPLSDGSAVKMTIAKYFLPAGSNIHETGIEPDVEVELTKEQKRTLSKMPHNEDPQLAAAIKALGGDPLPGSENLTTETTESSSQKTTEETKTTEEPKTTEETKTTETPKTTESTEE